MYQLPSVRVRELTDQLNQWRHEYYNLNAPTVSDATYDHFYDELERQEKETGCRMSNSPTQTVGYTVVEGLEKTSHTIPLLSLDKTKSISEVMRFIGTQMVMLMHKLDGLTVKLEYESGSLIQASTRGDGDEGEIITHNTRAIEGIPETIQYKDKLVVTGEVYILRSTFERLREILLDSTGHRYKNARNMAAGSVRCFDAAACAKRGLMFTPFSVLEGFEDNALIADSKYDKLRALKELGFAECTCCTLHNPSETELEHCIAELQSLAEHDGIPIDGIVITYNNIPYSLSCGRTGHHYKDGLALKFEDELYETVLQSLEWTPTRSGEISPVALFEPVEIDGCQVARASLHNLTFIKELELMSGCRIMVSKRNMIIPHVEENLDRGRFDADVLFPANCPCCGTSTRIHATIARVRIDTKIVNRKIETLYCDNPTCATQRLRQYVHFVSKKAMDIDGLSEATLEKFIGKGWLHSFMDIYRLNDHEWEICNITEGWGEKSWRRLWDAIQRSRSTTFERYLISMDIPLIGNTASKELGRYFSGDLTAFESAVDYGFDFTQLDDIGEVMNHNIHEWFKSEENRILWEELQTMLNIEKSKNVMITNTENPFTGRTVVVTGKLELFTRNSINAKIESLGAKAGSTVSKNTDYLICGDNAGSKLDKARQLGVPVLTEQEFLEMVEGN